MLFLFLLFHNGRKKKIQDLSLLVYRYIKNVRIFFLSLLVFSYYFTFSNCEMCNMKKKIIKNTVKIE